MAGGNRRTDDRLIPYVLFTDPPLARVGFSEDEAQRKGIPVLVAKLPMGDVLRTHATNETQGFMKVAVVAFDDHILGFTMIGSEAGEVMAALQTAMLGELPYMKLRDAVIARLTIPEGFGPPYRSPGLRGFFCDAVNDTSRLKAVIRQHATANFLDRIAAEREKGCRLFVMTTNLDAQQQVIWNMSGIAASHRPTFKIYS